MMKRNNLHKFIIFFLVVILVVFAVISYSSYMHKRSPKSETIITDTVSNNAENTSKDSKLQEILSSMTLSDMIYQMMFVTPESITGMNVVTEAGNHTKKSLSRYPVGGLVYFSQNLVNREQTISMLNNTQSYSKIPLFIGIDEEGGRVARLGNNPQMQTTPLPPMLHIGQSGDTQKAYEVGQVLGQDLSALGFNVDFAPDADVLVNPNNTEIGDRSFGSDPELVSAMVSNVVNGLHSGGVCATLKHFPGHGSTYHNSHSGYSESTRTLEELRTNEFLPFIAGIDADADFVMVSHMTLVNATNEKLPSSISREVITEMLKGELQFDGIVITDSLAMGAVTDMYSPGDAAIKAIQAGADMLLMTPDIDMAHDAILNAVKSGYISEEAIKNSVRKILSLKIKRNIIN